MGLQYAKEFHKVSNRQIYLGWTVLWYWYINYYTGILSTDVPEPPGGGRTIDIWIIIYTSHPSTRLHVHVGLAQARPNYTVHKKEHPGPVPLPF